MIFKNLASAFFSPLTGIFQAMQLRKFRLHGESAKTILDETWLLESVSNFGYFYRYYYYFKALLRSGQYPKRIICLNSTLFFSTNRTVFRKRLMDILTKNSYVDRKWKWIYRSIFKCDWVPFEPLPGLSASDHEQALKYFNQLKNKADLEQLKINGLWVGDLIYDTYLRFKPAPTPNIQDLFILELIQKTIAIISKINKVFDENKISRCVVSYSSYMHHGLTVRIAMNRGIDVYSLAGDHQLISILTKEFPYHTRNFHLYRKWFDLVTDKKAALEEGKQLIEARLSGQINATNSYMRQSSFANTGPSTLDDPRIDQRSKVVIMSHAFFDSPHCYGRMLFSDFYEWLDTTLGLASQSQYQFIVKPHPNAFFDDESVLQSLIQKFPNVVFLNKKTSNALIAKLPIAALVTVYGTVAHEFAALGHTVVCCGDNPHSAYSFCHEPQTLEEYQDILTGKKALKQKVNLEEVYEFMFVHKYRVLRESDEFPITYDFKDCIREFAGPGSRQMDMIDRELKNINLL